MASLALVMTIKITLISVHTSAILCEIFFFLYILTSSLVSFFFRLHIKLNNFVNYYHLSRDICVYVYILVQFNISKKKIRLKD
jgi:hypothetical protein